MTNHQLDDVSEQTPSSNKNYASGRGWELANYQISKSTIVQSELLECHVFVILLTNFCTNFPKIFLGIMYTKGFLMSFYRYFSSKFTRNSSYPLDEGQRPRWGVAIHSLGNHALELLLGIFCRNSYKKFCSDFV